MDIKTISSPVCLENDRVSEIFSLNDVAEWFGATNKLVESVDKTLVPKVKACNENDAVFCVESESSSEAKEQYTPPPSEGWSSSNPYSAKVLRAKWLSKNHEFIPSAADWVESKQVVHMEVCLNNSFIEYQPGDSIGISCPNPDYLIKIVFERLKSSRQLLNKTGESVPEITLDSLVKLKGKTKLISLHDLLAFNIDLVSVPKKANIAAFASYCTDSEESNRLNHLCSKGEVGKLLWREFLENQGVGLGELLDLHPSCTFSLAQLLAACTAIPPRYYSIASSPLSNPNRLAVAFSLVRFTCQLSAPSAADQTPAPVIRRYGVCTHYLQKILSHWLLAPATVFGAHSPSPPARPVTLRMFHKSTLNFHLPGSVHPPLIMIGPGTGVAPFIGFLEHRDLLENQRTHSGVGDEVCCGTWRGGFDFDSELPGESNLVATHIAKIVPGPAHLFFGCRNEDDYLYRDELENFLANSTLTSLEVAMSRVSAEKVYVTTKILERKDELVDLILHRDAYVYICGDGNKMAKDVYAQFLSIISEVGKMSTEEAEKVLKDMQARRRYVLDIWS